MSKQGFKELMVWQRAKQLAVKVYLLTLDNALAKHYALADQIRRSSVSVPSNIAEGDERDTVPILTECAELGRMLGALIKARAISNQTHHP